MPDCFEQQTLPEQEAFEQEQNTLDCFKQKRLSEH